jgi:hypothetical protein
VRWSPPARRRGSMARRALDVRRGGGFLFTPPPRWTDPAHGASRADGGAEHHSRWPPLHPLQCSGRRWQRAVVGRRQRAPLPRGLLFNPSGAAHGGGSGRWWDGSGQQWARPFSFLVFYSFENLFAESLKILTAHHCREHELQLTS